ncbi:MAG: VIT and VWA domain-containing protein [Parvibaculum sp.]|uniref:VIT and vWA domain-containing protein n=1 Tax=Parvibaculum sp. TaxID=2024848 RepID=UPI0032EC884A
MRSLSGGFVRRASLLPALALPAMMMAAQPADAAGLLTPANSSTPLAIEDHHVDVLIEDGYATTTIEQTFRNPGGSDLEAVYAFPVPQHAAVGEFTYWIDGKPVTAEVMKREDARTLYEREKAADRETALAEQEDFRRFQMSVWPVRANSDVRIRMSYVQPAKLDAGVGRYVYPLEEGGTEDAAVASFWQMKDEVTGSFSFDVTMRTSYPVEALRLPEHPDAAVRQDADGSWHVSIARGSNRAEEAVSAAAAQVSAAALNKDVALYWRQKPGLAGSLDVLTYKETAEGTGTFMAVLTPGEDNATITGGRDWTFILDRSGSMEVKFETLKEGIGRTLEALPSQDRFRVIFFDDRAMRMFSGFRSATPQEVQQTISELRNVPIGGGTNLYAGLQDGLDDLDEDRPSGVVLITDGVANVGPHERKDFVDLAASQDMRLFTVVMGNGADRPMLEHLAAISGGTTMNVSNSDDITGRLMTAVTRLSHHSLSDIDVSVDGVKVADVTPELKGGLYRGEQLVVFGHYWGSGPATFRVRGKVDGKPKVYEATLDMPEAAGLNPEIERLWAFSRIEDEMRQLAVIGEDADSEQSIADTAIEYGLLTPYTSMVVVREEIFAQEGIARNNQQRLAAEADARNARQNAAPTFASAPVGNAPRTHIASSGGGGGGGGGGAAGPALLLLLGLFHLVRVRQRAAKA